VKKILVLLLSALLLFAGCGNTDNTGANNRGPSTVQNGDVVDIDYLGKIDGIPFEGGTDRGTLLHIGAGRFIPGFEEQIVGMKKGDVKDINVTFPTQYHPDFAGKQAVFTITLNTIYRALD